MTILIIQFITIDSQDNQELLCLNTVGVLIGYYPVSLCFEYFQSTHCIVVLQTHKNRLKAKTTLESQRKKTVSQNCTVSKYCFV